VEVAQNGHEAIALVSRNNFDIVLMDMHMPEMDGLEATKAIRALPTAVASVPIVALTAAGTLSDIQACQDAGMSYFLVKPFRMDRLDSILSEIGRAKGER
jgi:CheY-like chemotaxis protein